MAQIVDLHPGTPPTDQMRQALASVQEMDTPTEAYRISVDQAIEGLRMAASHAPDGHRGQRALSWGIAVTAIAGQALVELEA